MRGVSRRYIAIGGLVFLSACAQMPNAPRVAVMPAPGKPFEVFVADERVCRDYAAQSIGVASDDAAARNFAGAAVVGTAVGAIAGAALGGHEGAGSGAAVGLLAGSMIGAGEAGYASHDAQRRYDIAYSQCMVAKGNQLPTYAYPPGGRTVVVPAQPAPYPYPPPPPPPRYR